MELNEQLQQRLVSVIDYLGESTKKAADFTVEQAPLVAQEIVRWGIYSHLIIAGICLLIGLLLLIPSRIGFSKHKSRYAIRVENDRQGTHDSYNNDWLILAIIPLVASVAMLIPVSINLYHAVKPAIAPRVYLIEWATNQLRKHG